ncbi:hypothetical protein ORI89_18815 [Sphingobacterium sp. UT-1RO-CII-1]|uniref:hypothetical protein n=1 Tax=Sphingobacterium sp. UT-1RO-CII-1 TaxID=2995225 RepID=UPI00227BAE81|nr:hypothetical protein [Sphingobacterium sp. UT-1RO-CII-1]MCY4781710.1 hypothetical protein [Sphingobacterium sp. UT-1RO-CII-1]
MSGDIVVIGSSLLVSNMATLDYHTDIIDTSEGKRSIKTSVFEIAEPFGRIQTNEIVDVAFKAEDGTKISYIGKVTQCTDVRCTIEITELTNNYKQIIRRAKEWQE